MYLQLQIFVTCTVYIFVTLNQCSLVGIVLSQSFWANFFRILVFCKKLVGFIFHIFVRNFTHICKKVLQICVKWGKPCLVGLGPGTFPTKHCFSDFTHSVRLHQIFSHLMQNGFITPTELKKALGRMDIRYNGNLPPNNLSPDNLSRDNLLLFKKATTCPATTCHPTKLSPVNLSPRQIVAKFYNIGLL
jgi:hypothetical protein